MCTLQRTVFILHIKPLRKYYRHTNDTNLFLKIQEIQLCIYTETKSQHQENIIVKEISTFHLSR